MGCLDCGRGFCALCGECACCSENPLGIAASEGNRTDIIPDSSGANETKGEEKNGRRARSPKSDDTLKDPHSTGRKRAALLFPLEPNKPCEWKGKAFCGGGKYPIIGCVDGKQEERHHGPDKNTLNNSDKNVHRICDDCHNIWHSQNDPSYDSYYAQKLHEPRAATNLELIDRIIRKIYVARKEPEWREDEYYVIFDDSGRMVRRQ